MSRRGRLAVCAVLLFGAALAPELAWAWKGMAHVCGAAGCVMTDVATNTSRTSSW